jgi:hypothetical protein
MEDLPFWTRSSIPNTSITARAILILCPAPLGSNRSYVRQHWRLTDEALLLTQVGVGQNLGL